MGAQYNPQSSPSSFPNGTTFIAEGNSEITNTSPPAGAGNDWWTQMQLLPQFTGRGFHFYNFALIGNLISDVAARYAADVFPHRPTANGGDGGPMSVLVIEMLENDVFAGTAAATISAAADAYCAQAITDGFFVVRVNCVPGGSHWDIRDAVNQYEAVTKAKNLLIDAFTLLPDNSNPLYYLVDGVHRSTQGNYVQAQDFALKLELRITTPVSVGPLATMTATASGGVQNSGNLNITGLMLAAQGQFAQINAQTNGTAYVVIRDTNGTGWWEITMQDDSFFRITRFDGTNRTDAIVIDTSENISVSAGFSIATVGKTVSIKSGTNALAGTFTLVAGVATVASSAISANAVIQVTLKTPIGTRAGLPDIVPTAGTGFVATAVSTDLSVYNWVALVVA